MKHCAWEETEARGAGFAPAGSLPLSAARLAAGRKRVNVKPVARWLWQLILDPYSGRPFEEGKFRFTEESHFRTHCFSICSSSR